MYIQFQNFGYNAAAKIRHFEGKNEYSDRIHQMPEILLIMDGSFELTVDGVTELAKKGDVCVITPFRTHSWHTPRGCTVWQLVVSLDFAADFFSGKQLYICGTRAVFTPTPELWNYVTASFPPPSAMQYNIDSDMDRYCRIKSIVYAVMSEYMRRIPVRSTSLNNNALATMLTYVNEHFAEDLTLEGVAHSLGYNKNYLSRCLHTIPGINFRRLVNALRIDRAKLLLTTTDDTVLNIALECGFSNERTLQRAFVELVGMTPSEYRR